MIRDRPELRMNEMQKLNRSEYAISSQRISWRVLPLGLLVTIMGKGSMLLVSSLFLAGFAIKIFRILNTKT